MLGRSEGHAGKRRDESRMLLFGIAVYQLEFGFIIHTVRYYGILSMFKNIIGTHLPNFYHNAELLGNVNVGP